jgi:hypothetical protein
LWSKERSIGANSYLSNQLWQLGEGTLQQRDGDRRDVGVAGMVAALPTILRVPLEAQQRKVRGAPALLGVVAHLGSFLTAVDRQHPAVQVEDCAGAVPDHPGPPSVVQLEQAAPSSTTQPVQEAPHRRRVRIPRQARQVVKPAVVAQRLGSFDSPQTQDQRVEQSLQRFADTVAIVPLDKPDVVGERALQPDALGKLLDQRDPAKLGEAHTVAGDAQISWSAGHCAQTSLLVGFQRKRQNRHFRRSQQAFAEFSFCS